MSNATYLHAVIKKTLTLEHVKERNGETTVAKARGEDTRSAKEDDNIRGNV